MDCSPWNSPGQNTGVDSLSLLQGFFPTQVSNPGILHCRRIESVDVVLRYVLMGKNWQIAAKEITKACHNTAAENTNKRKVIRRRKKSTHVNTYMGFPGRSVVKHPPANAGDLGSIPGSEESLEKEMATLSNILAWRISWTEKPGGLQSTGSHRAGHNWVTNTCTHCFYGNASILCFHTNDNNNNKDQDVSFKLLGWLPYNQLLSCSFRSQVYICVYSHTAA